MAVMGTRAGPLAPVLEAADWLRMNLDCWRPTPLWSRARTYDPMVKALAELTLVEFNAWTTKTE